MDDFLAWLCPVCRAADDFTHAPGCTGTVPREEPKRESQGNGKSQEGQGE